MASHHLGLEMHSPKLAPPLRTPVLLIAFNRPAHTHQTLTAIRKAQPIRLFIAIDGARQDVEGESELVAQVRKVTETIDWPCDVRRLYQPRNLGCKRAVQMAINWLFEHEPYGIILEDDCLPSTSFFFFCQDMLARYAANDSVMAVIGTNITRGITFKHDIFFSKYPLIWGWATWRNSWAKYEPTMNDWSTLRETKWLLQLRLGGIPFVALWKHLFDSVAIRRDVDTWDYQWTYSIWRNRGYVVAPATNLVSNIGFGLDATHTTHFDSNIANLPANEIHWPLKIPPHVTHHSTADKYISKNWFRTTWRALLRSMLRRWLSAARIHQEPPNAQHKLKRRRPICS
jgi:hypothetical protein